MRAGGGTSRGVFSVVAEVRAWRRRRGDGASVNRLARSPRCSRCRCRCTRAVDCICVLLVHTRPVVRRRRVRARVYPEQPRNNNNNNNTNNTNNTNNNNNIFADGGRALARARAVRVFHPRVGTPPQRHISLGARARV